MIPTWTPLIDIKLLSLNQIVCQSVDKILFCGLSVNYDNSTTTNRDCTLAIFSLNGDNGQDDLVSKSDQGQIEPSKSPEPSKGQKIKKNSPKIKGGSKSGGPVNKDSQNKIGTKKQLHKLISSARLVLSNRVKSETGVTNERYVGKTPYSVTIYNNSVTLETYSLKDQALITKCFNAANREDGTPYIGEYLMPGGKPSVTLIQNLYEDHSVVSQQAFFLPISIIASGNLKLLELKHDVDQLLEAFDEPTLVKGDCDNSYCGDIGLKPDHTLALTTTKMVGSKEVKLSKISTNNLWSMIQIIHQRSACGVVYYNIYCYLYNLRRSVNRLIVLRRLDLEDRNKSK